MVKLSGEGGSGEPRNCRGNSLLMTALLATACANVCEGFSVCACACVCDKYICVCLCECIRVCVCACVYVCSCVCWKFAM